MDEGMKEIFEKTCRQNAMGRIDDKIWELRRKIAGLEALRKLVESQEGLPSLLDEAICSMISSWR